MELKPLRTKKGNAFPPNTNLYFRCKKCRQPTYIIKTEQHEVCGEVKVVACNHCQTKERYLVTYMDNIFSGYN